MCGGKAPSLLLPELARQQSESSGRHTSNFCCVIQPKTRLVLPVSRLLALLPTEVFPTPLKPSSTSPQSRLFSCCSKQLSLISFRQILLLLSVISAFFRRGVKFYDVLPLRLRNKQNINEAESNMLSFFRKPACLLVFAGEAAGRQLHS